MKGIIIDGVASSGKTSILKIIHNKLSEQYPSSTKFFISEHYTERMLEHLKESGELNGFHIKEHFDKIIKTFTSFQNMLNNSKFKNNPKGADFFVTIERFILTQMASLDIENNYSIEEAKKHFKSMGDLGIKQVVLIIPKHNFKEKILSTINYRNEIWRNHLFSRGNEDDIVNYYINWQNKFLDYTNKFKDSIDTIIIEINDDNYNKYSDLIINKCFN